MNETDFRSINDEKLDCDKDLKEFISLLNKLRDGSSNDRLKCAEKILQKLMYKKWESISLYQFDAFLIKSTLECFKRDIQSKTDIVLMSFGLLKGYYYENMPGIGERRIKYIKESGYKPKRLHRSSADNNHKNTADNLRNTDEKDAIKELAAYLLELENISNYIEKINDYVEQLPGKEKNILYRVKLQIPSYELPTQAKRSESNGRDAEADAIGYCIESIRFSEHHDDVAEKLYEALCGQGEPPYDQWVATWILKCIQKNFKKHTLQSDIMYASFALLKDYNLRKDDGHELERRLVNYLSDSDYIAFLKDIKDDHYFSEIIDESLRKQILSRILKHEEQLTEELLLYISSIQNPKEHIRKLEKYGKINKRGTIYTPKKQKIFFRKGRIRRDKINQKVSAIALPILISGLCFAGISYQKNTSPVPTPYVVDPLEIKSRSDCKPHGDWGKDMIAFTNNTREANLTGQHFSNTEYALQDFIDE